MVSRSWSCCVVLQITSGSWVEFQCPKFWCSSRRKNRPRTRTPQRRQKGNRCNRGMSRLDWRQTFIVAEVASFWSYMILWCYMYIWLPASGNHMGHIMAYFICWEHIGRLMIARYIYIYRLTTFDCKEIKQNLSDWAMRSCNYPWSRLSN